MPSLRDVQRRFSAAVMFEDPAAMASLKIVTGGIAPARRVAVYRNNILGNYRSALAITYPVVRRLVGCAFFDAAADIFARGHPSLHGDVNRYGGDFAAFLDAYPPARELPYLPDVARLEWALDQSNIAADAQPMDTAALARVRGDALASLRFVLHPAARLIASPYPVLHIWRANQADEKDTGRVDLGEGGEHLLVSCTVEGVGIERIGAGAYAFLSAVADDAPLSIAAERAADAEPSFDLGQSLRDFVSGRIIVAFHDVALPTDESMR